MRAMQVPSTGQRSEIGKDGKQWAAAADELSAYLGTCRLDSMRRCTYIQAPNHNGSAGAEMIEAATYDIAECTLYEEMLLALK
jgi:hypothetical protein